MDRHFAAKVMKSAIILHKVVVEARRNEYQGGSWSLAGETVKNVSQVFQKGLKNFLDKNGKENVLNWNGVHYLTNSEGTSPADFDNTRYDSHIASVDARIKDGELHYAFELDLVDAFGAILGSWNKFPERIF